MPTVLQLPVPPEDDVVETPPVPEDEDDDVGMPPMPLELEAVPEELVLAPELDECVVVPVVLVPLVELHAARLAPVEHPMIAPAISQPFFMKSS